jgi:hypothetical protein
MVTGSSALAATYEGSLSVRNVEGTTRYLQMSLRISRSAARFRRDCTRQSSTSPSASTARHRYILLPPMETNISSRWRRVRFGGRSQTPGDHAAEHRDPTSDRFVGDVDTALGQQFFDVSEAQRETTIEPDRVLDDLGWETVASV